DADPLAEPEVVVAEVDLPPAEALRRRAGVVVVVVVPPLAYRDERHQQAVAAVVGRLVVEPAGHVHHAVDAEGAGLEEKRGQVIGPDAESDSFPGEADGEDPVGGDVDEKEAVDGGGADLSAIGNGGHGSLSWRVLISSRRGERNRSDGGSASGSNRGWRAPCR